MSGLRIVAGVSASGKGTIIELLLKRHPNIKRAVTCTTRAPRGNSQDQARYRFLTDEQFDQMIQNGLLFEHETVWGYRYGLPVSELERAKRSTNLVLLELDIRGVRKVLDYDLDARAVFLYCDVTKQKKRLIDRNVSTETLDSRMAGAASEIALAKELEVVFGDRISLIDNSKQSIEQTYQAVEKAVSP
jgi:guanylate kinase